MEAVLFILDSAVLVAMMYWGLMDDRRPAGKAQRSLFRFIDDPAAAARARKSKRVSLNAPAPTVMPRMGGATERIVPRPPSAAALRRADAVRSRIP